MRKALCVGIDNYPFGALTGCVSDADRLAAVFSKHQDNSPNFDTRVLKAPVGGPADVVTRSVLREAIENLFKDPAEVALLSFSGHGSENNLGGFLVTQDAKRYDEGVPMTQVI